MNSFIYGLVSWILYENYLVNLDKKNKKKFKYGTLIFPYNRRGLIHSTCMRTLQSALLSRYEILLTLL